MQNSLGFKGISKNRKRFMARCTFNGRMYYLGNFIEKSQAAMAYDAFALAHFGEFALTNQKLGLLA